jgi:hypothetical protein
MEDGLAEHQWRISCLVICILLLTKTLWLASGGEVVGGVNSECSIRQWSSEQWSECC